jgi:2-polyprenyl-3-methyl-5-hydroxy-6-metoxy-1,4-benzoquinol methylase
MCHVVCNCCGADDTSPVLTGHDLLHGIAGEFTLVQCNRCGLMYMNPQPAPEELETYYPEDYEAHVGTQKQRLGWLRRLDYNYGIEKRYRAIMRFAETGRMLDVGCGAGAFLDGMRERGWRVAGVEPGMRAAVYARDELGLEIQNTTVEAARLEPASLDLVTMWNVLEHLSDPQQGLHRLREALRPGGLLVFAIPNVESYDLMLFRKYWAGYDLPRHLFVFPPKTLERMVESAGFELLDRRCIYGTYNAFAYSARFMMNARLASTQLRTFLTRLVLSLPVRVLMMPACRIVDLLNRGTIVTWFCRKKE